MLWFAWQASDVATWLTPIERCLLIRRLRLTKNDVLLGALIMKILDSFTLYFLTRV